MVSAIQLLKNVGQFESITPGAQLPFARMSFIYAENGRGKTTVATILRSLSNGDPRLIADRHRLGSTDTPHIILDVFGGGQHIFQHGAWSAPLSNMAVFDDAFVSENVCSGIEIEPGHRQNLHELILGAQGVSLNAALQGHVTAIEEHNRQLRQKENAISATIRFGYSTDEFCMLQPLDDIDTCIQDAERMLAAAQAAVAVQAEPDFVPVALPSFDVTVLNQLLARDMAALDFAAAAQVQTHLAQIGTGGERWINDGVAILSRDEESWSQKDCPFCVQPLFGSAIINHYRSYFSAEYTELKNDLVGASRTATSTHSGDAPAAFERAVATSVQRRNFWLRFLEVPEIFIDTAEVARQWKSAREKVQAAITAKQGAPLEPTTLNAETIAAINAYHTKRDEVTAISEMLTGLNGAIALVKEQAQAANADALATDLNRLRATKSRHSVNVTPFCLDLLGEKQAKQATESIRDIARTALDNYRQNIFPAYETAINAYLGRFNAGFRLGGVSSINNRGGSSATYNVVIENIDVPLMASVGPSFRTALSAGDRNTLALAFFFASLEQDTNLADKIVVVDDPMTSLDEHRSLVTVQEVRRLVDRVRQVIVLSHSKPFLIESWKAAPRNARVAMRIARAAVGSSLEVWDVDQDSVTEHDRRYARVTNYLRAANASEERTVAADLRPMLEKFIRVAYASIFPPGSMIGRDFLTICQQRLGSPQQILPQADSAELRALLDYANRYHHDTNPTWQTENINDAELTNFASRTLAFIRRS
jgi:wobble nucleotide-excising tRNase